MVSQPIRRLMGFVCFPCLALLLLAQTISAASPPSESPRADADLICNSVNTTDCYPRVLIPTKDFQPIREGQDIPPGLHVRMNVYTGEKEARLNIPMEGEEGASSALEGIPTEQALVIVEQPEEAPSPSPSPPPEDAGSIPQPPPSDEFTTFQTALLNLQMSSPGFLDSALDDLKELSHDIYYGLQITSSGPSVEKLICLTLGSGSKDLPAQTNNRDRKAAGILANSIQNNPTALKEVSSLWKSVMYPICSSDPDPSNVSTGKSNFVSILRSRLGKEKDAQSLKAKVAAISRLLRSAQIRENFIANGGMELLSAIFLKKGEEFDGVREKVAQLITDNFLDEHMGAALKIFPKRPATPAKVCLEDKTRMLEDGCWEAHVESFQKQTPGAEWTGEFLGLLKEQRRKWGSSAKEREL